MGPTLLSDWLATVSLIFGGCCSNAITLEQLTSEYPHAGSLITFFQFLVISIHGLPKYITMTRYGPRFKPRKIPLTPYLIQVVLFYLISLLNNAAFAYRIPMAVHIIFRSGGLIISMLLGWLVVGKRYNLTQVIAVLLVTLGVILTTLSASQPQTPRSSSMTSNTSSSYPYTYLTGIAILTIALLFSGFLGIVQDRTYATYGRPPPPGASHMSSGSSVTQEKAKETNTAPAWQESMFYLHFLALPMFIFVRTDLATQFRTISGGPRVSFSLPIPLLSSFPLTNVSSSLLSFIPDSNSNHKSTALATLHIPAAYLPLLLNVITQLLCVAGVHRLTTRVSALSVTLVLVVRKAVSLVLSVVGVAGKKSGTDVNAGMLWSGAVMVLVGTVLYSIGSGSGEKETREHEEKVKDKLE